MPHGLHLAYLTGLQRLTLLNQAVYGLQASLMLADAHLCPVLPLSWSYGFIVPSKR